MLLQALRPWTLLGEVCGIVVTQEEMLAGGTADTLMGPTWGLGQTGPDHSSLGACLRIHGCPRLLLCGALHCISLLNGHAVADAHR